jgi:O-antigen/teichoic acid export membrane protein
VDAVSQAHRVVKNSVFVGASVVGGGLLQLATMLVAARGLGLRDFGTYSVLLAFAWVFQQLADFGVTDILVRELATQPAAEQPIFGAARSLIWMLSIAVGLASCGAIAVLPWPLETKVLAGVMSAATLSLFHSASYAAAIKAREEMHFTAAGYFFHKVFLLAAIGAAVAFGGALRGATLAHLAANFGLCAFYAVVVRTRYFRLRMRIDVARWKQIIVHAIPLGGGAGIRSAASQIDVLILKRLADVRAVGLFNAPLRLVQAPALLPIYLAPTLFPVFSRLALGPREKFAEACERSVRFFLLLGCPAAAFLYACAPFLVHQLLGRQFAGSVGALRLMAFALPQIFLNALLPYVFTALRKQRAYFWVAAGGLALRIGLNVALIPRHGYAGACVAMIASESAALAAALALLCVQLRAFSMTPALWKLLAAGALLCAAMFPFRDAAIATTIPVLVGAVALYLAAVIGARALMPSELQSVTNALGKLTGRRPAVATGK